MGSRSLAATGVRERSEEGTTMRRTLTLVSIFTLLLGMMVIPASADAANPPTTTWNEQPQQMPGNDADGDASCPDGSFFFRINGEDVGSGSDLETSSTPIPGTDVIIHLTVPSELPPPDATADQLSKSLDFEIENGVAHEVRVKGGPNGYNVYDYLTQSSGELADGPVASDTYLHSPPGSRPGTFGGLSHISFCYEEVVPASILFEKTYTIPPLEGESAGFTLWPEDDVTQTNIDDNDPPADGGVPMVLTTVPGQNDDPDRFFYCADDLVLGDEYWIFETEVPTGFEDVEPFKLAALEGTCEERLDPEEGDILPQDVITNEPGPVDLVVTKYKLTWDEDTEALVRSDTVLEGFEYRLFVGHDLDFGVEPAPVAIDVQSTDADGEALFTLDPEVGEYTVCETGTPDDDYWAAPDEPCQEVTATLADVEDGLTLDFENEPLSKVELFFYDMTGYTKRDARVCRRRRQRHRRPDRREWPRRRRGAAARPAAAR
jgi:hypothetical protein